MNPLRHLAQAAGNAARIPQAGRRGGARATAPVWWIGNRTRMSLVHLAISGGL